MAIEKKEVKKKFFQIFGEIGENTKCPPQAKLIVDTLKANGGRMSREDLIALLKRSPEDGGMTTNQTVERIIGFYKPRLSEMGVVREEEEITFLEVEVADKPAKAKKEKPAVSEVAAAASGDVKNSEKKSGKGEKGEAKVA